ncbi:hypothetical protein SS50377_21081 [Spironucleus salmonicida]|uniref:Uncharacterized protein n=1 Tax=Spironucleus salmonicida TaxID=348837 RepID=V6LH53_9EUKA|nr:hypothetical protein SS50377_21081 [Spironucleus salmonicida]|eukprot:EST43867.1 hypothetical protein SS50377_16167 [Spironucleus salmonicida]
MSLEISTDKLVFYDIANAQKQIQVLNIRNSTLQSVRIRATQPKTSNFRIQFQNLPQLAPGLSMQVPVELNAMAGDVELADTFTIATPTEKYVIALNGITTFVKLQAHDIDFGIIPTDQEIHKILKIRNTGTGSGDYAIKITQILGDKLNLDIEQSSGKIAALEELQIPIYINSSKVNVVQYLLEINELSYRVTASIQAPSLILTNNNAPVQYTTFQSLFYIKQTQNYTLCNVSPFPLSFDSVTQIIEFKSRSQNFASEEEKQKFYTFLASHYKILPSQGTIPANKSIDIQLCFTPKQSLNLAERANSFMKYCNFKDWDRILGGVDYTKAETATNDQLKEYGSEFMYFTPKIDDFDVQAKVQFLSIFKGDKQVACELIVQSQSRRPLVVFSDHEFHFKRNQEKFFEMKSMNHYPVRIEMQLPPGFKINSDMTFTLQPKESRIFQLSYEPNSLTDFDGFFHINIGNSYYNVNIGLLVNKDQLPKKLQQTISKVDSRVQKEALPLEMTNTITLSKFKDTIAAQNLGMDGTYKASKLEQLQNTNYCKKYMNEEDSDDVEIHHTKVTAYNDHIDLGLGDTAYDSAPFTYKQNPKIIDRTQQKINENIDMVDQMVQPKKRPALQNDILPTNKTYPQSAFDAIQFNKIHDECKVKLAQRQLSIITTGTTDFEFNQVTVGTTCTKYYKIANDLQNYVKVELAYQPKEDDVQSCEFIILNNPQYLPPGCYTSFGIQVLFSDLNKKFYDKIQVFINDQFYQQLNIKAEVIRPQLRSNYKLFNNTQNQETLARVLKVLQQPRFDMEQTQDCMFFNLNSENAFQKRICQTLMLTNVGTSDVQTYLSLQQTGDDIKLEFTDILIPVNSTIECKVEWIPSQEPIITNTLEISFEKGTSYYIPIITKLNPGKANILEKQIDLGLITVSQQIQSNITLQNKNAQFPLFYEILQNEFNNSQNFIQLVLDSQRGEISAEDSAGVQLSFIAQTLGNFNIQLQTKIIGGETISLNIKGAVEVAYVMIEKYTTNIVSNPPSVPVSQSVVTRNQQSISQGEDSVMLPVKDIYVAHVVTNVTNTQKLVLTNRGKVAAGIFVDASHAQFITLQETQDNNVTFNQYQYDEMINMFSMYQGQQFNNDRSPSPQATQRTDNMLTELAYKYNLPVFKNCKDDNYTEYLNNIMNNVNINDAYGGQIYRNNAEIQIKQPGKVLYINIPVGQQCVINIQLIISQVEQNIEQSLFFWILGQKYANMTDSSCFGYNNQLKYLFSSQNAVITLSNAQVDFGIKVSDNGYKQSILASPSSQKQLYQELFTSIGGQQLSKEELQKEIPFMKYLANTGLFSSDINISNTTPNPVYYTIVLYNANDEMINDNIFSISQPFGQISSFDSVSIRIYFSPTVVGQHVANAKIYYISEGTISFFQRQNYLTADSLNIQLNAVAIHKNLVFDNQLFFFPNTVVNQPSRIQFNIYNVGFKQNTRLQMYFPPELSKIAFNVIWPFGNVINHMIKYLPVVVSFVSAFPISFNSKIAFLDDNNVPYYVFISGNAYNDDFQLIEYNLNNVLNTYENDQLRTINYYTQNPDLEPAELMKFGISKTLLLALQSVSAKPFIEFSEYAISQNYDAIYKNQQSQFNYEYILVNPITGTFPNNQNKLVNQVVKQFIQGPFITKLNPAYDQKLSRVQFYWMNCFKQLLSSEVPFSPFIPYLTDIIDISDNQNRLQILLNTINLFYGQKVNSFPSYFTNITNRSQQFLIFVAQTYGKSVNFTLKQVQNIPTIETQKVDFLASCYESFLNTLKIHGAMLNNIHFSLLLSQSDFLAYTKKSIAILATNAYTIDQQTEFSLINSLISSQNAEILTNLLKFVHQACHQSAWFFVLQEIVKISLLNVQKTNLSISQDKFKNWILGESSEFQFKKAINSQIFDRATQSKFFTKMVPSEIEDLTLKFIEFYAKFQIFNTNFDIQILDFKSLISGVEIGLCILSFAPSQVNLAQKVEDVINNAQKIADTKLARNQTDFMLNQLYKLTVKPIEISEKSWQTFQLCRKELWKEICMFLRNQFNFMCNVDMFYQVQINEQNIMNNIFCTKILASLLYLTLPSLIPSKSLKVTTFLGENIQQAIEVSNPYKSALKYNIQFQYPIQTTQSCDIGLSLNQIIVETKQTNAFNVQIKPNFLKQMVFIVQLTPVFEAIKQLQLPNNIFVHVTVQDKSVSKAIEMECFASSSTKLSISIENITQIDAKYKVSTTEKFYPIDVQKTSKQSNIREGKSQVSIKTEKVLNVKGNGKANLNLIFSPTHPGLYISTITLQDENVGQKMFEIKGFSLLPDAAQTVKLVCQASELKQFSISATDLNLLDKINNTDMLKFALMPIGNTNQLSCTYNANTHSFILQAQNKAKMIADMYLYKLIILTDNITRVYEIILNVLKRIEEVKVHLQCIVGERDSYQFTVTNVESSIQEYQLTFQSTKIEYFLIDDQSVDELTFTVQPNDKRIINLSFNPSWIIDCTQKLVIRQSNTNILAGDYVILAKATEPKSKAVINLECAVMQELCHQIQYINPTQAPVMIYPKFEENADIFRAGQEQYEVQPGQTGQIDIYACHYVSGNYLSHLYLNKSDGTYVHYNFSLKINPRNASGILEGKTKVSQPIMVKATIQNPSNKVATFYVAHQDIPSYVLSYQPILKVQPKLTSEFEIQFLPYAQQNYQGTIKFSSEQCGEFWYNLKFDTTEIDSQTVSVKALIGQGIDTDISIVNDKFDFSVLYNVNLSNQESFKCQNIRFTLDSREEKQIKIQYKPSKIGEVENCIVNIYGKDVKGNVIYQSRYNINGEGTLQSEIPIIKVYAQLNQGTSGQIAFKNPFLSRASVKFEYEHLQELQFTCKDQLLEPSQMIYIKYIFIPKKLNVLQTSFRILINPNWDIADAEFLPFEYTIDCIGEYTHRQPLAFLSTSSRQQILKTVQLPPEVQIENLDDVTFDFECANITEPTSVFDDIPATVRRSLTANWTSLMTPTSRLSSPLPNIGRRNVTFTFYPLKPFACDVLFVISTREGGRYKLPIQLFADDPKTEGLLTVELPNGHTPGEYILQTQNILNVYSEYRAYFTPSSSDRFSISPERGILEPGASGIQTLHAGKLSQFVISCQVGNSIARGQLIIETKDIMFIWDVISGYKKYVPPTGIAKIKDQ